MTLFGALLVSFALGACGDQAEPELDARAVDARPPVADAGACVVWPASAREPECKALCVLPEKWCTGEQGGCLGECIAFQSGTYYCPAGL